MNATRVTAAEGVVFAAMQTRQTARGIASALEAACMLQSPESAAEMRALRAELSELREGAVRGPATAVREALEGIADDWAAHCPDHSTSAETSMACRCDDANELRLHADGTREDAVAALTELETLRAQVAELETERAKLIRWHAEDGKTTTNQLSLLTERRRELADVKADRDRWKAQVAELKTGVLAEQRHWIDEDDTTFQAMPEATS